MMVSSHAWPRTTFATEVQNRCGGDTARPICETGEARPWSRVGDDEPSEQVACVVGPVACVLPTPADANGAAASAAQRVPSGPPAMVQGRSHRHACVGVVRVWARLVLSAPAIIETVRQEARWYKNQL